MVGEFDEGPRIGYPRRSVGPIVLLVPIAFLALALSLLKNPPPSRLGPRAVPPVQDADGDVAGWEGEFTNSEGERLSLTLGPLHSDVEREQFDSRTLARRFGLSQGQVFKLEILRVPGDAVDLPQLSASLSIKDAAGTALSPLCESIASGQAGPFDPLRVLFAPPEPNSPPGDSTTWFLWGRAPGPNASVEGFVGGVELALEPRRIPRERVDVALLRREQ